MPKAAYCSECREFVWLTPAGACSQGHPRPCLRHVYESRPVSGRPVPPMPTAPKGHARSVQSNDEYEIRPMYEFVHPVLRLGAVLVCVGIAFTLVLSALP